MILDSLPLNTPVIIGVAAITEKTIDLQLAHEAIVLMQYAIEQAAYDAGNPLLLKQINDIAVPQGFWAYSDPARLLAKVIGSSAATTCLAGIGVTQQTLINRACEKIAKGEIDIAVVVGGEAKFTELQEKIQGKNIARTVQMNDLPDISLTSEEVLWSALEAKRGLLMPAEFYALMESSICTEKGHSLEQHREYLGSLYSGFSAIAAQNKNAWFTEVVSSKDISEASEKNPFISFPYTKRHNPQWNVNQAGSVIFCSVKKAQELGIAKEKWVFPLAGAVSEYVVPMSQRPIIHRHSGTQQCAKAVFSTIGLCANDIDLVEVYSCFPSAVQSHALDIGITNNKPLNQTGGMAFYGGPLNNFVIQATVKMIEELRLQPEATGLVSTISGINGKQGIGLYSTTEPQQLFIAHDVTELARTAMPSLSVLDDYAGEATIVASTVVFAKGLPSHAFAIAQTKGGERLLCVTKNSDILVVLQHENKNGTCIIVSQDGNFTFKDEKE